MARQGAVAAATPAATPRRSKRQRNEEPSAEKPRRAADAAADAEAGAGAKAGAEVGAGAGAGAVTADAAGAAPTLLDRETVEQAAAALLAHRAAHAAKAGAGADILDASEDMVSVVVSLKRAPRMAEMMPRVAELAHPLYKAGEDDVCFFVKDPQREVKDLLEREGVAAVTKVLAVSKLEKRYGTHEGRRELAQLYDLFLVDDRVVKFMPRLLGNVFVKGKKMPLTVRMGSDKSVVKGIERAMRSTSFQMSRGTTMNVKVARASFSTTEIADNVEKAVQSVSAALPGEFGAIQALFIKTSASPSLPVHFSAPEAKDFAPTKEDANAKWEADRLQRKRDRARMAVAAKEEKLKARSAAKKVKKEQKRAEKFAAARTQKEAKAEAKRKRIAEEDGEDSDAIAEAIQVSFAAGEAEFELSDDESSDTGDDSGNDSGDDGGRDGEAAVDAGEAPLPMPIVPAKRNRAQRRKETSDRPLVRSAKETTEKPEGGEPRALKETKKEAGKPAPKKKAKKDSEAPSEKTPTKANIRNRSEEKPSSKRQSEKTPAKANIRSGSEEKPSSKRARKAGDAIVEKAAEAANQKSKSRKDSDEAETANAAGKDCAADAPSAKKRHRSKKTKQSA